MLRKIGIVVSVIAVTSAGIADAAFARAGGGQPGGGGHIGGGFTSGPLGGQFGGERGPSAGHFGGPGRREPGREAFTSQPSGLHLRDGRRVAPAYRSDWGWYGNCWPYDYINPHCY